MPSLVDQNGNSTEEPVEDKRTPEQKVRDEIRSAHTAAFMADFDDVLNKRLAFNIGRCKSVTGLPSGVSLHGSQSDARLNKFVTFMLQELAVMQTFQGKTFGRLLDILEARGMPSFDGEKQDNSNAESECPSNSNAV